MKVTLSLTHRCNLACRYCYAGRIIKRDMLIDTAYRAVDFALRITPPGHKLDISFFGGEPLLCFDLMRDVTAYIRERTGETKHPVHLSITTNGTVITQPILDFLKAEQFDLCISLDGPAHVHNLNRRYKSGRGSYAEVVANLQKAVEQLDMVQVNAVYDPETVVFLPETVEFLLGLGVTVLHLNPDIGGSWNCASIDLLQDIFRRIADCYLRSYQNGQEIAINIIDSKIVLFMKGGYTTEDMCGMGDTQWAFAPSGNIYPCERFIGEDDDDAFCLGNLYTGLDRIRQCTLLDRKGNRNKACQKCDFKKYCMNWCGCTNFYMTGHIELAGSLLCSMEKAAIQAARIVGMTLSENDNELFVEHFMNYLHEGTSQVAVEL